VTDYSILYASAVVMVQANVRGRVSPESKDILTPFRIGSNQVKEKGDHLFSDLTRNSVYVIS